MEFFLKKKCMYVLFFIVYFFLVLNLNLRMLKNCLFFSDIRLFIRTNFILVKNKKNVHFFDYFFDYFIRKYLSKHSVHNICVKILNINLYLYKYNKFFNFFFKLFKKYFKHFKLNILITHSFLHLLISFFFLYDAKIFLSWLKQLCEGIDLKRHKFIFSFLNFFLAFVFNRLFFFKNFKGYFLSVKGKISGTGNSKKRKVVICKGFFNLSDNFFKISYCKSEIRTFTGVLGVMFYLIF